MMGSILCGMKVLVFAGSTRKDSFNRKLAVRATDALRSQQIDTTFADLRDYPMPLYDGDSEAAQGLPATAKAFKELVREHDTIVIASPEYNGSFPALVKNTIDWITRPEPGERPLEVLRGKTAALLSTSPGPGAGKRGLKHLRELLEMTGLNVLPEQVNVAKATQAFDAEGQLIRPDDANALNEIVRALAVPVTAQ
jgi:chromate reductase, NAD(P)H dehydrogenase (quinone)